MYLNMRYLKQEKFNKIPLDIKKGIAEYYNNKIPAIIRIISLINDYSKVSFRMDGHCLILTSPEKTYFIFDTIECWELSE